MVNRKPPLVRIHPLEIVATEIGVFVHTPLGQLLMSAMRDSDDNINRNRLATHSVFAVHCLHRN